MNYSYFPVNNGKFFFSEECHLINVEGMTEKQITSEIIESSKDHKWMLKSLYDRFLENRIFPFAGSKMLIPHSHL